LSEVVKTKVDRVNNAKVTETPEWRRKLFVNVSKQEFVNFRLNAYTVRVTRYCHADGRLPLYVDRLFRLLHDGHATVLTVALMLQCCICRLSSSVCDVMYCG